MNDNPSASQPAVRAGGNRTRTIIIAVVASVLASVLAVWLLLAYWFPGEFKPVQLSDREQKVLSTKLDRLDARVVAKAHVPDAADSGLQPEKYTEDDAAREINISQRELNALLAQNTDLAQQLAINLSSDMASAKLLLPLDPDFPVLGGKTLKLSAGVELAFADGRPVVALRGLSLWGVPMPNAWLGGLKNVDLVSEFGGAGGFWSAFADGVEYVQVKDGELQIKLKE